MRVRHDDELAQVSDHKPEADRSAVARAAPARAEDDARRGRAASPQTVQRHSQHEARHLNGYFAKEEENIFLNSHFMSRVIYLCFFVFHHSWIYCFICTCCHGNF